MNSKTIMLSSSLMGIFIAIQIIKVVSPINIGSLMTSALFGLFWSYFTTKQNLSIQGLRIAWNLTFSFRSIPQVVAVVKGQTIAGMSFLDYFNSTLKNPVDLQAYELLRILGASVNGIVIFKVFVIYCFIYALIVPYVFYRYFKRIGIYKRLPSF
jgi:hypothetical protein